MPIDKEAFTQRLADALQAYDTNENGRLDRAESEKLATHIASQVKPEDMMGFNDMCDRAESDDLDIIEELGQNVLGTMNDLINGEGGIFSYSKLKPARMFSSQIITDGTAQALERYFPGTISGDKNTDPQSIKLADGDARAIFDSVIPAAQKAFPNGISPIRSIEDACEIAR